MLGVGGMGLNLFEEVDLYSTMLAMLKTNKSNVTKQTIEIKSKPCPESGSARPRHPEKVINNEKPRK